MAYDTGNLQNVLQYMQQQQGQGRYVPTNGVGGVPSAGWDGWNGYKPPQTQSVDGGGIPQDMIDHGEGSFYGGNGSMGMGAIPPMGGGTGAGTGGGYDFGTQTGNPNYASTVSGPTSTGVPQPVGAGQPGMPGGGMDANGNQSWVGQDWSAQMNSQAAPAGYNPGMDLPGVINGVQTHNFTPQGNNHVFGDLTGYKNNPASAAGTPYARFMTGGNGNGPQDFNRAAAYGYLRSGGMTGPGAQRQAMMNRQAMAPRFGPNALRGDSMGNDPSLQQTLGNMGGRGVMPINPGMGIQSQGGGAGGAQRFNLNPGGRGPMY